MFVRDVLDASDTEFGVLIALFGVGAALGLGVLLDCGAVATRCTRRVSGVAAIGGVIAVFSLASSVWLAFIGATAFGAAAAFALSSGMGALQSRLEGNTRVAGLRRLPRRDPPRPGRRRHRAPGLAGDLLGDVKWPWVGRLEPSRVVLLCSGLLVLAVSTLVREHAVPGPQAESGSTRTPRTEVPTDAEGAAGPESSQEATA